MEHRKKLRMETAFRDEHVMDGVMCGIDAVGFQAPSRTDYSKEDPNWVIAALAELPGWRRPERKRGQPCGALGDSFQQRHLCGFGRDQDKRYDIMLRNLIIEGRVRPGKIVSHRLPLAEAPDAFRRFDARQDGYIKVILDPHQN